MNDYTALVALAVSRYPDMEPDLALMCFESDRRRAGLGALDECKRGFGKSIANFKRDLMEHRQIRYHLVRRVPARLEYPRMSWEDFVPTSGNMAEATITLVQVPARNEHFCIPADYRDMWNQSGRNRIAAILRKARRSLMATSPESTPQPEQERSPKT